MFDLKFGFLILQLLYLGDIFVSLCSNLLFEIINYGVFLLKCLLVFSHRAFTLINVNGNSILKLNNVLLGDIVGISDVGKGDLSLVNFRLQNLDGFLLLSHLEIVIIFRLFLVLLSLLKFLLSMVSSLGQLSNFCGVLGSLLLERSLVRLYLALQFSQGSLQL